MRCSWSPPATALRVLGRLPGRCGRGAHGRRRRRARPAGRGSRAWARASATTRSSRTSRRPGVDVARRPLAGDSLRRGAVPADGRHVDGDAARGRRGRDRRGAAPGLVAVADQGRADVVGEGAPGHDAVRGRHRASRHPRVRSTTVDATGSAYLGFYDWPHDGDAPVTKTIAYTNDRRDAGDAVAPRRGRGSRRSTRSRSCRPLGRRGDGARRRPRRGHRHGRRRRRSRCRPQHRLRRRDRRLRRGPWRARRSGSSRRRSATP